MSEERFDSLHDVFERMDWEARTNFIPDWVKEGQSMEAIAEARQALKHALNQGWITQAALARHTGLKSNAISTFLNDKWVGKSATLQYTAQTIAKFLDDLARQSVAKETEINGYVTIRLAQEIRGLVEYAKKRNWIAMFTVPAGSGKTVALEAIQQDTPGAVLMTVRRGRCRSYGFMRVWAEALRVDPIGRVGDLQDRIISALAPTSRLMLIDEAHKLSVEALDSIREVWDAARIPIVMAATPVLYQTVHGRRINAYQREILDQLSSRVRLFRDFTELEGSDGKKEPRYNVADIRKLFERGNVRLTPDGAKWLCGVALIEGAGCLRACHALVQLAVDLFPGEPISADVLKGVAATCFNREELERFTITDDGPTRAAASA